MTIYKNIDTGFIVEVFSTHRNPFAFSSAYLFVVKIHMGAKTVTIDFDGSREVFLGAAQSFANTYFLLFSPEPISIQVQYSHHVLVSDMEVSSIMSLSRKSHSKRKRWKASAGGVSRDITLPSSRGCAWFSLSSAELLRIFFKAVVLGINFTLSLISVPVSEKQLIICTIEATALSYIVRGANILYN